MRQTESAIAKPNAADSLDGYSLALAVLHCPSAPKPMRVVVGATWCFHCWCLLAMVGMRMEIILVGLRKNPSVVVVVHGKVACCWYAC